MILFGFSDVLREKLRENSNTISYKELKYDSQGPV